MIVFLLLALFVPGKERFLDPGLIWFGGGALLAAALGFRFPRAAGIPLLALVGLAALAASSLRAGWTPFGSDGDVARLRVLSMEGGRMELELDDLRGAAPPRPLELGGDAVGLVAQTMRVPPALGVLGLRDSWRLVAAKGGSASVGIAPKAGFFILYSPADRDARISLFLGYTTAETATFAPAPALSLILREEAGALELVDERGLY